MFMGTDDNPWPAGAPPWLSNVVAIACGSSHAVALRANGTVVSWGDSPHGQTNVPPSLDHVISISAGADHTLALRDDGTLVGWGGNQYGQLDTPVTATNAFAVVAGPYRSLALLGISPPVYAVSPTDLTFTVTAFELEFPARRGANYFLIGRGNFHTDVWQVREGLVATDTRVLVSDLSPAQNACFYSIRCAPHQ
jgi:hypothetical protein